MIAIWPENSGYIARTYWLCSQRLCSRNLVAEKEKSMNESTFTADYLTGVFSWGNLAALPKKEKPEVLQYRACLKDGGLQEKVL